MIRRICSRLGCAVVLSGIAAQAFPAAAQNLTLPVAQIVTREKARLVLFDGETLTLERLAQPQPSSTPFAPITMAPGRGVTKTMPVITAGRPDVETPKETPAENVVPPPDPRLTVAVTPQTRYVGTAPSSFAAIKPGDFVGAAVTEDRNGRIRARQLYRYPEDLRGTGEGRFPEGERILINGTVSEVKFAAPDDQSSGTLALQYRGAVLTPLGRGRTVCEGRAAPPAVASPLACKADAVIQLEVGTPVTAMTVGDRSLLEPGVLVTVTIVKGPDGRAVTPGVVVEKPVTVEKPQSPN